MPYTKALPKREAARLETYIFKNLVRA
ncbi:hypothetical protein EYZ11_009832 [Aspergillus tanneri]|uniref:Uncharacterized protein n=1 Tax=Aspergillus tanneri TaxID=1220188 RepID=A0A4S3J916_9EURO|nr:hypothetical protein EYZ11_009832 [Aspergillus tanneri]